MTKESQHMRTFFITFGCAGPLANDVVCIAAKDDVIARRAAFSIFDKNWAFIYDASKGKLEQHCYQWSCTKLFCVRADYYAYDDKVAAVKRIGLEEFEHINYIASEFFTRDQIITFLVDSRGYNEADLVDLPYNDLIDGLDLTEVARFVA